MRYVANGPAEEGCIFCNRLARANDIQSLILHRAEHSFIIMNLFPYNTGHVMVVPNAHVAGIDQLEPAVISEMACLLPPLIRALRRVFGCDGFNIGFNQGSIAGAGVAEHVHQHVVPRWEGDANFMPILAGTMVMPELIPSSYAKIRAELEAEILGILRFDIVLLDDAPSPSAWLRNGKIPTITVSGHEAVWRNIIRELDLGDAEVVGYSGPLSTRDRSITPGLVIRTATTMRGAGWRLHPLLDSENHAGLDHQTQVTLPRVRSSLPTWISANMATPGACENPLD